MKAVTVVVTALFASLAFAPNAITADPDIVEGTAFTRSIAVFDPPIPANVTIDWGDGSAPQPSVPATRPDGKGEVTASHTYAKHGSYHVVVSDKTQPTTNASTNLTVVDAAITANGTSFKVADAPAGVLVATITDANPLGVPGSLKASIDWGDGSPQTDGVITAIAGQPGHYEVRGSHTFPDGQAYLMGVNITSNDSGDAKAQVQSSADGVSAPDTAGKGPILDMGRGEEPSLAIDDKGTAHLVWETPHAGRTGGDVVYCQLPRGAKACAVKRRFIVDALNAPVILRDRAGTLRVVVPYNGVLQIGGGTLIMSSSDNGANWSNAFVPVNTGIFQGSVVDATLSQNGRVLYAIFGDFAPGDKDQTFAAIGLDRPILNREEYPGRIAPPTGNDAKDKANLVYSARSVATLPDGRIVLAGFDTRVDKGTPRAAMRVVADADDNPVSAPWTPIRSGEVHKVASSPRSASILTSSGCVKGVEVAPVRGLRLGPPRPVGSERFLACNSPSDDLFVDTAGGRHVVFPSDHDGCQGTGPYAENRTCLIYRRARPGGDFGPKTTIAALKGPLFSGVKVVAAPDGGGWIAWRELTDNNTVVKVTPTLTTAEEQLGKHLIALTFKPGSECAKKGPVTLGVKVSGPQQDKPSIAGVTWSTTPGLLPRRKVDTAAPYALRFNVDRREFDGLSSTGTIVFSMTVHAKVRYRAAGRATKAVDLSQVLSWYCGVPFSKVRGH